MHAHCVIPEAAKLLGPAPPLTVRGAEEAVIALDQRLAAMDAQAVDIEVLSINPNWSRPTANSQDKWVKTRTKNSQHFAPRSRAGLPLSPR